MDIDLSGSSRDLLLMSFIFQFTWKRQHISLSILMGVIIDIQPVDLIF